jgi:hypothetical protein
MVGRLVRSTAALVIALGLFLPATVARATMPPDHKVTICHRTGSAAGGNTHMGYSIITVDIASSGYVMGGHADHEQVGNGPGGDIIPAYDYTRADGTVFHYPGKNLDTSIGGSTGAEILANGCKLPPREFKWTADASSDCRRADGHVIVKVVFTNQSAFSITVTATEITFTGQSQTMDVAPGQTVLFQFDVGHSPKPPGEVTLDLGWTDGFPGVDSGTLNHSATPLCGPPTAA